MKMKYLLALCFTLITYTITIAQDCGVYFPLVAGTTYEFNLYRGQGKSPYGKMLYQIKPNGIVKVAQLKENGKPLPPEFQTGYTVYCNAKTVRIKPDSTDLALTSLGGMTLPADLKEGSELAKFTTSYYHKSHPERKVGTVELYNFKVTKESVTVPAGTFEAFVIDYDFFNVGLSNFIAPTKYHRKEWYVSGKGLVRFEKETSLGFVQGELTSIKKE